MKTCVFANFTKGQPFLFLPCYYFFSWCIFCCCGASEREACAEKGGGRAEALVARSPSPYEAFLYWQQQKIYQQMLQQRFPSERHHMSSPIAPSLRVFLPRHLASIRLRFHCFLSRSIPESSRHLAGGTCSALRVTAGYLVLGDYPATRRSRFDGFLGRQLYARPCTRLGYVQNNLFGRWRWLV